MASITEPRADLAKLAERLRSAADVLRSLPAELEALREEISAVAARLRRK